jgi:hypothetical protein
MMTVSQFSPLYLPFPVLIRVIESGFQQHAYPCWLDAAAKIVSVYYFETTGGSLASKLGSGVSQGSASTFQGSGVVDLDSPPTSNGVARHRSAAELENEAAFTHLLAAMVSRTMDGMQSMAGNDYGGVFFT